MHANRADDRATDRRVPRRETRLGGARVQRGNEGSQGGGGEGQGGGGDGRRGVEGKGVPCPSGVPRRKGAAGPHPVVLEQSLQSEGVVLVLNEWPSSTTLSLQRAPMTKGLPAPPPTGVGEGSGKEGREEAEGQSKN